MSTYRHNGHNKAPFRVQPVLIGLISLLLIGAGVTCLVMIERRRSVSPPPTIIPAPGPTDPGTVPHPTDPAVVSNPGPGKAPAGTPVTPEGGDTGVPGYSEAPKDSPAFLAAITGNLAEVKRLITRDPSLVKAREPGQKATLLQWAVAKEQVAVAAYLLEKGAEVNVQGKDGWTPLHTAALLGNRQLVKMLLARGAAINAVDYRNGSALFKAVGRGHRDVARLLLSHHPDVNIREKDNGMTALHQAVLHYEGKEDYALIKALLGSGARVNVRDTQIGYTPLQYARMKDDVALVSLLKQHGARE